MNIFASTSNFWGPWTSIWARSGSTLYQFSDHLPTLDPLGGQARVDFTQELLMHLGLHPDTQDHKYLGRPRGHSVYRVPRTARIWMALPRYRDSCDRTTALPRAFRHYRGLYGTTAAVPQASWVHSVALGYLLVCIWDPKVPKCTCLALAGFIWPGLICTACFGLA